MSLLFDAQNRHDVEQSIKTGADVNKRIMINNLMMSPLDVACKNGNIEVFEALVDNGADYDVFLPDFPDEDPEIMYNHPMLYAFLYDNLNIIKKFVELGVNMNKFVSANSYQNNFRENYYAPYYLDVTPVTGLMIAAYWGYMDIIDFLVLPENKDIIDLDLQDENGFSALFHACIGDSVDVVTVLLDNGANINLRDKNGGTILHNVVSSYVFDILLNYGTGKFINATDDSGNNILQTFLSLCNDYNFYNGPMGKKIKFSTKYIKKLLDWNININGEPGTWPTIYLTHDKKIIKFLIQSGADINASHEANHMENLLGFYYYYDSYGDDPEFVQFLINNGININHKNDIGNTIINRINDPDIYRFLIENGARPNIQNNNGFSSIDFAIVNNNQEIIEIYRQWLMRR